MMLNKHHFSTAFEVSKTVLSNTDNKCYVVSSSSRGIGLEFTKQLLSRSSSTTTVIGLYRTKTDALSKLQLEPSISNKLKLVYVDLESQDSILQATQEIQQITNKVDMLINTAGILGDGKTTPGPERAITAIDRPWMEKTMQVNLFGLVMMSQALIPLMKRSSSPNKNQPPSAIDPSRIVNLSARVGSISDNSLGGWYSYRMSKAALNMFTKTCSIEMKRHQCIVLSIHPGTTDTDLSVPFQKNVQPEKLFPVAYSVDRMLDVIWKTKITDTGKFYAYDGTEIPF